MPSLDPEEEYPVEDWLTCYNIYLNEILMYHYCCYRQNKQQVHETAAAAYNELVRDPNRRPTDKVRIVNSATGKVIMWPPPMGRVENNPTPSEFLEVPSNPPPLDLPIDTVFFFDAWYDEQGQHVVCYRYWDQEKNAYTQISKEKGDAFMAWRKTQIRDPMEDYRKRQLEERQRLETAKRLIDSTDPVAMRRKQIDDTARRLINEALDWGN